MVQMKSKVFMPLSVSRLRYFQTTENKIRLSFERRTSAMERAGEFNVELGAYRFFITPYL